MNNLDESEEEDDKKYEEQEEKMRSVREEYDTLLQSKIDALVENFRRGSQAEVDSLVGRARAAWDEGLELLLLRFPSQGEPQTAKLFADQFVVISEARWNEALARITAIGWRLHTWTVTQQGSRLVPVPLFERPTA